MDDQAVKNYPEKAEEKSSAFIRLLSISKGYSHNGGRIEVLENVDFDIEAGESIAVVGASGIGKSTFLHILGTLDRPDGGRLFINDEDVFRYRDDRLADFRNRAVGFVFQFHHLLPEFSAIENVMMPVLIGKGNKEKARNDAEKILGRVGLSGRLEHRVTKLSGGEQQRVALARALVMNPPLLLADEPTGNLDKKNSEQVHELFEELNRELGMTVVVVTHNMDLADHMGRRVTLIDRKLNPDI